MLQAVRDTSGTAIAVTDDNLLTEQRHLAESEGTFVCPDGAACLVAARQLREAGWLKEPDQVVILNTGTGIKYPQTINIDDLPIVSKDLSTK